MKTIKINNNTQANIITSSLMKRANEFLDADDMVGYEAVMAVYNMVAEQLRAQ